MKLREEGAIIECRRDYALAEGGDGFRNDANVLLFFRRQEKGSQKGTMDAIAEGESGVLQAGEELVGELRRII
jgi:hypothetical protein